MFQLLNNEIMKNFNLSDIQLTKYSFFTGKGGVGKTSIACATAVGLADLGKKILLISTDPASNLQDVFGQELNGHGTDISEVPGLVVVNLDPEKAAAEYRESVISPYRGKLPESVIRNMEEQLSGSCTVEIAAFNEFSDFITDEAKQREYDHIIFDTAPTGHTLRMLQLPSAWSTFISESTHGASCLGQLSGLEERKGIYKQAVSTLSDEKVTSLVLVARPDLAPLKEAARSSHELNLLGIKNQILIINGVLQHSDDNDNVTRLLSERQNSALYNIPEELKGYPMYSVPLRSYNLSNIENIRKMLSSDNIIPEGDYKPLEGEKNLDDLVDDLFSSGKRVIFTMGKGGVGKTTLCGLLIQYLCENGKHPVLAVDADANANLNEVLGVEPEITLGELREEIERAGVDPRYQIPAGMTKQAYLEMRLSDAIAEEDDYDLMVMGRTQGQGCYCFVNGLVQTQVQKLQSHYPYIVVDNEAGMEHISRGILPMMEVAILVSDCSRRGVQAAGRIAKLMKELNFKPQKTGLIVNRVPDGKLDAGTLEEIRNQGLELLGVVPHDDQVYQYDCDGKPIIQLPKDSPVRSALGEIVKKLGL